MAKLLGFHDHKIARVLMKKYQECYENFTAFDKSTSKITSKLYNVLTKKLKIVQSSFLKPRFISVKPHADVRSTVFFNLYFNTLHI